MDAAMSRNARCSRRAAGAPPRRRVGRVGRVGRVAGVAALIAANACLSSSSQALGTSAGRGAAPSSSSSGAPSGADAAPVVARPRWATRVSGHWDGTWSLQAGSLGTFGGTVAVRVLPSGSVIGTIHVDGFGYD